jgi:hypothetical protein
MEEKLRDRWTNSPGGAQSIFFSDRRLVENHGPEGDGAHRNFPRRWRILIDYLSAGVIAASVNQNGNIEHVGVMLDEIRKQELLVVVAAHHSNDLWA